LIHMALAPADLPLRERLLEPLDKFRVWCLEQLRVHFAALPDAARDAPRALLEAHGCWRPLFLVEAIDSRYDPEGRVPFHGRTVHYDNAR
jgi:hypothetical protein